MQLIDTILHASGWLRQIPDTSVNCCVTSPPYYGLRDYGIDGQIGLEQSPQEYITRLADIFDQVRRVLRKDGTLWVVIGDSYAGSGRGKGDISRKGIQPRASYATSAFNKPYHFDGVKNKDLVGIPWMLAFELRRRGWYLRQDIIWSKPNPMPESVRDRCTKSHEYIFLLSKSQRYYFDYKAIMESARYDGRHDTTAKGSPKYTQGTTGLSIQGFAAHGCERWQRGEDGEFLRNKRDVWNVPTKPFRGAHFAVFPEALICDCISAGCPAGGVVLDPFAGSGTTAVVAKRQRKRYIGIELNADYIAIANERLQQNR